MESLLWWSVAALFYIYFGYPLCLVLLAKVCPRPVARREATPRVTVIIPAFNEARHIAATIENKLAQDYPADSLEIIVVSDESTDGTDEIVERYVDRGVKLIRQVPRQGKSSGLNLAAAEATGEILVFSDANSIYAPGAIRAMVANFSDERVGYVTGKMVYANADGSITGDGCSAYMRYENLMRDMETRLGSVVGVDGGVDAMRRSLFVRLNADQLPDFVTPLRVVEQGYRVVYEPTALLQEDALSEAGAEYRMRVRVSLRALWALWDMRALFAGRGGVLFAWQLLSHKLLRYLAFIPMLGAFLANALLAFGSAGFALLFLAQLGFYALAWHGYRAEQRKQGLSGVLGLPYYFSLLNLACAHAFLRFVKREKQVLWTPRVG